MKVWENNKNHFHQSLQVIPVYEGMFELLWKQRKPDNFCQIVGCIASSKWQGKCQGAFLDVGRIRWGKQKRMENVGANDDDFVL